MPSKKPNPKPKNKVDLGGAYDVGYSKPPEHTQWPKGTSGNSKGKKKGSKALKTIVEEEANGKIVVKENGLSTEITKLEAIVKQLGARAIKGNDKATSIILDLVKEYLTDALEKETASLTEEELKILDDHEKFLALKEGIKNDYNIEPEDNSE